LTVWETRGQRSVVRGQKTEGDGTVAVAKRTATEQVISGAVEQVKGQTDQNAEA
jgi:hypothetical protein